MSQHFLLVLAAGAGACIALQAAANGSLRTVTQSPLWTAFFSICGTFTCAVVAMTILRPPAPAMADVRQTAWWHWVGGPLGALIVLAGAVLNCTGPAEGGYVSPLYRSLQDRGMIQTDEVDLGIRATPDFAVVDKNGSRSKWLTVLGPPLRGSLWETTAVPELRAQAFRIAEGIIGELHALRTDVRPIERTYADVLEYSI
jgi:hypothetical protein